MMITAERIEDGPRPSRASEPVGFVARLMTGLQRATQAVLGVPALRCRMCGTHMVELDSRVTYWDGFFAVSKHFWRCPECGARGESDQMVQMLD